MPFGAIVSGRQRMVWSEFRWQAIVIGVAIYVSLRLIHPLAMGGFN